MDFTHAGIARKLQLKELECLRIEAYENTRIYKEWTKAFHDHHIRKKDFQEGDKVIFYNSRLRLMPGKLCSRWDGPYKVKEVRPYGVVKLLHPQSGTTFKVNGHQVKRYHEYKSQKELEMFLLEDPPSATLDSVFVQGKRVPVTEAAIQQALGIPHVPKGDNAYQRAEKERELFAFEWSEVIKVIAHP
ncbi:uncharacterized protein [Arachis hypogaea]|uniref:uncharacterized protein n=1 Tax=Arachis hypogaea TaxID=3818 RepID=UPI003B215B43